MFTIPRRKASQNVVQFFDQVTQEEFKQREANEIENDSNSFINVSLLLVESYLTNNISEWLFFCHWIVKWLIID